MIGIIDALTLLFVAISSLAAWRAVSAALAEARQAGQTHRGQLYTTMSSRYADREMHQAIHDLRRLHEADPDSFAAAWLERFKAGEAEALERDADRRLVSAFFFDVLRLYELDILDRSLAASLLHDFGTKVYVHICLEMGEPMFANRDGLIARFREIKRDFGRAPLGVSQSSKGEG